MRPAKPVPAVTLHTLLRDSVETLRTHRAQIRAVANQVDLAIAQAEALLDIAAARESGAPDLEERVHLAAYGQLGALVMRTAQDRSVPLRDLLGPGAPRTNHIAKARRAVVVAFQNMGVGCTTAARVLRVSEERARQLQNKKAA